MSERVGRPARPAPRLVAIATIFAVAALMLLLVFRAAEWRAETEVMTRYCDDPARHLQEVGKLLAENTRFATDERRSAIVAARLLFLVPRRPDEPVAAYLSRLDVRIDEACG